MNTDGLLNRRIARRTVLGVFAGTGAMTLLAACNILRTEDDDSDDDATAEDIDDVDPDEPDDDSDDAVDPEMEDPDDDVDPAPDGPVDDDDLDTEEPDDDSEEPDVEPTDDDEPVDDEVEPDDSPDATVIAADVIEYQLDPDGRWDGPFGSVTMRLHRGWVDGEDVTFIRTDASDADFAQQAGLVHVPLLAYALDEPGSHGEIYLFDLGPAGQLPVMSSSPADGENFSSAFRVNLVEFVGKTATPVTSEQEILQAVEHGNLLVTTTDIVVNYPLITWPGGQAAVDNDKTEALGGGQLIEEPGLDAGQVTFKLHQCYPGNRYIITDTSMAGMASMMGVGVAEASQLLIDARAIAPVTIFLNGLEGTGALGFQPGLFNTDAGDPVWSPFWEHFSVEWVNEEDAVPVTSQAQLDDLVDEGLLVRYRGVPETDPDTFVVNCPVPIIAPVTWSPEE